MRDAVIRVAQRLAVLAGLLIGGWLLGSATGWADEDQTHEDRGLLSVEAVSLPTVPSPPPTATVPQLTASAGELLSTVQPARLPAQPSDLGTLAEPIGAATPESVLRPVLDPVVREATAPLAPDQPAAEDQPESLASAEALISPAVLESVELLPPAEQLPPAEPGAWATRAASAPLVPPDAAADQFTGWSAGSVHPMPAGPGPAPVSCPAGSAAATATLSSAHAVTLNDGCPGADLAGGQRQLALRVAGLPGIPDQQPSTSPD